MSYLLETAGNTAAVTTTGPPDLLPDRPPPNPAGGGLETRQGGGGWGMGLYTGARAAAALRFAGNGGRNLKKRAAIFLFISPTQTH